MRRFPSSRRHPQHDRGALERTLQAANIRYAWLGTALGGRVPQSLPAERSPNRAWTVEGFRNYADGMVRPEFAAAIEKLELLAREVPTALLCAERLWWKCHRRLLADLFVIRGWRVVHLLEPGKATDHELAGWARVRDGVLCYPGLL